MNKPRMPKREKKLMDYFPSRFLRVDDLHEWKINELSVEVTRAIEEPVQAPGMAEQYKLVLYFKTKTGEAYPRGYLVSAKADVEALASHGCLVVGDLAGKRITIFISDWRGQPVLRIKPAAGAAGEPGTPAGG